MTHLLSHQELKQRALSDPETKRLYNELEEEFLILEEFIHARHTAGKTQSEVAESMGTKTSAIGRLESSLFKKNHSPTLSTLRKYAKAIGYKIEIHLVPDSTRQA